MMGEGMGRGKKWRGGKKGKVEEGTANEEE